MGLIKELGLLTAWIGCYNWKTTKLAGIINLAVVLLLCACVCVFSNVIVVEQ